MAAFVYDDQNWSSQWNGFEAQAVAALFATLYPRMQARLLNELDGNGNPLSRGPRAPIGRDEFWLRDMGVVTPHRAQQSVTHRVALQTEA